jgi:hypothetical protein
MKATVADGTEAGDVVTVGGLLALGSYPQEYFPQLMLTFVHYPTERGSDEENGTRFLDSVAIEGPVTLDNLGEEGATSSRNASLLRILGCASCRDRSRRPDLSEADRTGFPSGHLRVAGPGSS